MSDERKPRRTKTGRVASNKMNKTVVVAVEMVARHRLYGRTLRRTRNFKAHDEGNRCEVYWTTPFKARQRIALDARLANDGAQEAGVRTLIGGKGGILRFRLAIVDVTIHALGRGDGRQHPLRAKAPGQPDEYTCPPAWLRWRY